MVWMPGGPWCVMGNVAVVGLLVSGLPCSIHGKDASTLGEAKKNGTAKYSRCRSDGPVSPDYIFTTSRTDFFLSLYSYSVMVPSFMSPFSSKAILPITPL